ncbi:MAG TPA: hypothetical protein VH257_24045, partial [Chloroflexota bacterium]|nr:hypothetical protein [Chloroflexota bacterium]
AGQPISFVYDLATSRIPARRVVQDEVRVAEAPVEVERPLARRSPRGMPTLHAGGGARNVLTSAMSPMQFDAAEAAAPAALATIDEMERQEVGAAGSELGELFQYEVVAPVTVGRGASALVPILGTRLPYRRELLFNQRKLPLHPVVTLRFQNDTGLVLERGPVTVVEDGDYRGEAIVPFTRPGREVALAFAVELGITVRQTPSVRLEQAGLRIEKALLWSKQARLQETEYLLASELGTDEVVTVEHPILPGYDLVQTPPPDEQTADWYRWRVPCPPGEATTFVVTQRTIEWQQQLLLDVSYEALRTFLERRWLDPPTLDRIRALLRERQAIARGVQEIATLQAERERIFQRQEQLRQNLGVLSTSGQEAALRQQVFLQLQASEGRLNAIDERAEALEAENRRRQEALDAALEELAVEEQGDAPADGSPSGGR